MLNSHSITPRVRRFVNLIAVIFSLSALASGLLPRVFVPARAQSPSAKGAPIPDQIAVIAPGSAYRQNNLVSDSPGVAFVQDPLLVNPWGIAFRGTSPFWVANNGTSTSTLYSGDVGGAPLVKNPGLSFITIPGGLPTGTVGNPTTDFVLPGACSSPPCAANFIFSSITGNISGWNSNAPAAGSLTAVIAASHPGHVYTGLALANNGVGNFLYAADFANGTIDVFDSAFALQPAASFPFIDPTIPTAPGNTYHPFNIQNIGGSLYVAYAKVDPMTGLDEEGVGNGYVRRFNTNGVRDLTFGINNGPLNSPWGLTIAPASFGIFGGALLVGNFGEGNPSIHAFNPTTGAFLGTIQDESGNGIEIDELWALTFGVGGNGGDPNTLYFTAGIGEEEHGLFGSLKPTTASATNLIQFADDEPIISEGAGHIDITVTRIGDVSGTSTVNYATFDQSQPDHASQKTDYELAVGTLNFAPGETNKTFRILIVDDEFDEGIGGLEDLDLILSNPTGAGTGLGTPNTAVLRIADNDVGVPATNPIDGAEFFVRQHFLDFFNREPDASSLALINQILACGANASCTYAARADVSASFFKSNEFRETGFLAYMTHQAAFGAKPLYGQFELAKQALGRDVVTGDPDAPAQLEANKQLFFNQFVTRPDFVAKYPSTLTNAQFVDALLASAGLSPSEVRLFVVSLTNGQEVPPTNPTASGGGPRPASFGTAKLQFNSAQTAMTFTSTVNNIDFTGAQTAAESNDNLTAAHIHAGAAVTPATNGPVVWGFFGTPFNDNNPNDQVVTPFSVGVGGSISGKWDAPEGNGTTLAAQLSNLREGRAYVNFHTTQFPGGEIRGNIPAATNLRDSLIAGLNGATLTRAGVLRTVAEQEELRSREFNAAVANIGFFEYFRRDADIATLNTLLSRLNSFSGDVIREAARLFITAIEYRQRFGSDPAGLFDNTAPDAVDDAATANIDTPITIDVLANDTDFENNQLFVTGVTAGTGGTPAISGNKVIFTPTAGFTGTANFQYTVTDNGTSTLPPFSDDPKSDTATVTVNVVIGGSLQFSATTYSVSESAGSATITITRTGGSAGTATVLFQTSNGTAGFGDYTPVSQTVTFVDGDTSETVTVPIINDSSNEPDETVNLTLSNPGGSGALGTPTTAVLTITNDDAVVFNFSEVGYVVTEDGLHIDITVNRSGDPAAAVQVNFASSDTFGLMPCSTVNGNASQRCDYNPAVGTLKFAASQTSKTFRVFVHDDVRVEGAELLTLTLSNPVGGSLGAISTASLILLDHVVPAGTANPIDDAAFFIRTLYVDFLYREPDTTGFNNWLATINGCPNGGFGLDNPTCDRVHVATSFFGSQEFGERGYFVYRLYDAALGRRPTYAEFNAGLQQIGGNLSPAESEVAKIELVHSVVLTAEFQGIYAGLLTPAQANAFISKLELTSGFTIPEPARSQLVSDMASGTKTPEETLKAFLDTQTIFNGFFNRGFVSMLYFGYLHRDPDTVGFNNWLTTLNATGNYRALTFGFIYSNEYRLRFGPA